MLARKKPPSGEMIPERPGVPPRDVNPFVRPIAVVPHDRHAMRRVLAREPEHPREPLRTDVLESNQADSYDGVPIVQLRLERRRQLTLNDVSVGTKIHQQPSSDHAVNFWELHTRGRLTSGLTVVSSNHIKPLSRRAVQADVGLPHVAGPAANELRILFFSGRIANICNRHRASMRKILRPREIDASVKPARDLPVQLRVAPGFDAAAQPREVRDEGFHRPAVFLGVLHRVGVDNEVMNRTAAGSAPGSRGELIENALARLSPGDPSPAQWTRFLTHGHQRSFRRLRLSSPRSLDPINTGRRSVPLARSQIVEANQVDVPAAPVLRHAEQVFDAGEA
jgi:hypothetical protein